MLIEASRPVLAPMSAHLIKGAESRPCRKMRPAYAETLDFFSRRSSRKSHLTENKR